jgi:hypothetical protein
MTTDYTDIFDRYFEKSMSDSELLEFDQRLVDDVEFSREYSAYVVVVKASKLAGEETIRKTLSDFTEAPVEEALVEEAKVGRVIEFKAARMLYAAAVVVVLVGTGLWAFLSQNGSPEAMYADNFDVYAGLSNTRGDADLTAIWSTFSDSYSAGDYEICLVILGEAEFNEVEPQYLIHFYSGVCLMALEKPNLKQALLQFDEVLVTDNDYHAQSLWYQGLAYLSMGNEDRAKEKLDELVGSSKYKSAEVQEILDDL